MNDIIVGETEKCGYNLRALVNVTVRHYPVTLSIVDNIKKFHHAEAVIKGASNTVVMVIYYNLLCHENGNNVFTYGWAVF